MSKIKIGVLGCMGRMGRLIAEAALRHDDMVLAAGLEQKNHKNLGMDLGAIWGDEPLGVVIGDDPEKFFESIDIAIDFTAPSATETHLKLAEAYKKKMVIGTTGLSDEQFDVMKAVAKNTSIVYARNYSLGVNLLLGFVEKAAAILDDSFDIEILEMHHREKVDAPSGTALALGEAAALGRNVSFDKVQNLSRVGHTGKRPMGQIGIQTLRGGTVAGDHEVLFAGNDEKITLAHHAASREIFVRGALKAAHWAASQKPGLYDMQDVLGL